nr:MAG TPA: hypothetical protein [Caudoviricetes sp.]
MIKAEDLRIGDLVRVNHDCMFPKGTMCKVVAIDSEKSFEEMNLKGCANLIEFEVNHCNISWGVWCKYISPIPLTPEILEKNGFKMREDTVVYAKNRLGLKPLGDGKGYQVGLGSLRFLFVKVRIIKYVHELQHIIWALDLDANLKI